MQSYSVVKNRNVGESILESEMVQTAPPGGASSEEESDEIKKAHGVD
jgi:hypothetical protein